MSKFIFCACIFFVAVLTLPQAKASIGAVSTATGGTGRGAVEPVDGVLLNPSTISDLPGKNFSVNTAHDTWAMSVADNGDDAYLPAALQFIKQNQTNLDTQQLGLSLATPRWKGMTFGLSASMVEYTQFPSEISELHSRQSVFDLSATLAFSKNFGLGLVARKVGSSRVELADALQVQKTVSMGLSYTYLNFARMRFDIESAPENKLNKLIYMAGLENYLNDWLVFRLGYKSDTVAVKDYFSAGMGFGGPQFGLHYAYISNVANKSEDQHLIDLGIPF
jgi:hypothetical protein